MSKIPTLQELLEAGVHFGHQAKRWNPKMAKYIFTQRDGIHVIDLEKTEAQLKKAVEVIKEIGSRGGVVIFIATKKQVAEIVKEEAKRVGALHLTQRWFGGLLTNFDEIKKTIEKLPKLEEELKNESNHKTKREQLLIQREINKLEQFIGGIKGLDKLPDALFIVDSRREENAVKEANKVGIPTVALVDTNADPTQVTYPIAANDDAIRSVALLVKTIADAYEEGLSIFGKSKATEEDKENSETETDSKKQKTTRKTKTKVKKEVVAKEA